MQLKKPKSLYEIILPYLGANGKASGAPGNGVRFVILQSSGLSPPRGTKIIHNPDQLSGKIARPISVPSLIQTYSCSKRAHSLLVYDSMLPVVLSPSLDFDPVNGPLTLQEAKYAYSKVQEALHDLTGFDDIPLLTAFTGGRGFHIFMPIVVPRGQISEVLGYISEKADHPSYKIESRGDNRMGITIPFTLSKDGRSLGGLWMPGFALKIATLHQRNRVRLPFLPSPGDLQHNFDIALHFARQVTASAAPHFARRTDLANTQTMQFLQRRFGFLLAPVFKAPERKVFQVTVTAASTSFNTLSEILARFGKFTKGYVRKLTKTFTPSFQLLSGRPLITLRGDCYSYVYLLDRILPFGLNTASIRHNTVLGLDRLMKYLFEFSPSLRLVILAGLPRNGFSSTPFGEHLADIKNIISWHETHLLESKQFVWLINHILGSIGSVAEAIEYFVWLFRRRFDEYEWLLRKELRLARAGESPFSVKQVEDLLEHLALLEEEMYEKVEVAVQEFGRDPLPFNPDEVTKVINAFERKGKMCRAAVAMYCAIKKLEVLDSQRTPDGKIMCTMPFVVAATREDFKKSTFYHAVSRISEALPWKREVFDCEDYVTRTFWTLQESKPATLLAYSIDDVLEFVLEGKKDGVQKFDPQKFVSKRIRIVGLESKGKNLPDKVLPLPSDTENIPPTMQKFVKSQAKKVIFVLFQIVKRWKGKRRT